MTASSGLKSLRDSSNAHRLLKAAEKLGKRRKGRSISTAARDLMKEALADLEGAFWTEMAEEREKSFTQKKALPQKKLWKKQAAL